MPPITSVGISHLRELVGEVEADEHTRRVAARLGRALRHHLAHELDVARVRILPEAEARERGSRGSGASHSQLRVGRRASMIFSSATLRARRARAERRVRERRQQHDARDALAPRSPGTRCTNDCTATPPIECPTSTASRRSRPSTHRVHVVGEVLERVTRFAEHRLRRAHGGRTRSARNPALGSVSSWWNQVRTESVTPCESTIGGPFAVPRRRRSCRRRGCRAGGRRRSARRARGARRRRSLRRTRAAATRCVVATRGREPGRGSRRDECRACRPTAASPDVPPRDARTDAAHDRRRRSCRCVRPIPSAVISSSPCRPSSTTSSPTSTGQVADVEHQLVHRDRARDRRSGGRARAPAPPRCAELARHAVGVADRNGRDRASPEPSS